MELTESRRGEMMIEIRFQPDKINPEEVTSYFDERLKGKTILD